MFDYADLFKLRTVQAVRLSPDGKHVAFVLSAADIQNDGSKESVWLLRISDRQLIDLASPPSGPPVWSPDSQQLALTTTTPEGNAEITVLSADAPTSRKSFHVFTRPESLTWSPNKRFLAMVMSVPDSGPPSFLQQAVDGAESSLAKPEGAQWASPVRITQAARYQADGSDELKPGRQHLFLLSTDNGELRQITSGPFNDKSPSWLPDSSGLLFASDRQSNLSTLVSVPAIQMVNLLDGSVVQLSHANDYVQDPISSPDGRWIAYTSTEEHHVNYSPSNLFIMRADGSETRHLAPALDRDVYGPQWSADGRSVYASYLNHGLARVGRFDLDGRMSEVASGTDLSFSMSISGDLAYAGSTSDRPAEVTFIRSGTLPGVLTSFNSFLQDRRLGRLQLIEVASRLDGVPVEGWILLPPNAEANVKLPTILELHGGPFGFDDPGWSSKMQLYAAAGYAVVFANYRGSTSYGSKFSEPANFNFPDCAYDDLMSVMDAVVQQGIADPNRLFVTGVLPVGSLQLGSSAGQIAFVLQLLTSQSSMS